jgi:FAD/FMN-containing dehydrogenase
VQAIEEALKELMEIVGEENFSADRVDLVPYTRDSYSSLMRRDIPMPDCVVLPSTTAEVQSVVLVANRHRLPIYPRSFGVNLAGSSLPYGGGIVVDLKRMDKIHEINRETMTATIEPGVTWGALRKAARAEGLDGIAIGGPYCVGPVGNFLLTNITHYATIYSPDRAVTLEGVLPNGQIIRTGSQCTEIGAKLNPYFRYAYGPDVAGLFRGSMGNYGIITRMVMRLRPLGKIEETLLYGFNDLESALLAMRNIERMEITRCNVIYNNYMLMHVALAPNQQRNAEERERVLRVLPRYILFPSIKGDERLIKVYKEVVDEEVGHEKGDRIDLPSDVGDPIRKMIEGTSDVILRMYAPFSGYGPAIAWVPSLRSAVKVTEEVDELIKKYDIKDPLSGEVQVPERVFIPYDRCSSVYVEQELLYDPAKEGEAERFSAYVREIHTKMFVKYGAVQTIPNRSLLRNVMDPSYSGILKGIKRLVDPNGIMLPHGPFSFE